MKIILNFLKIILQPKKRQKVRKNGREIATSLNLSMLPDRRTFQVH